MMKNYNTSIPGIKARISESQKGDIVNLRGFLIDSENERMITSVKQKFHHYDINLKSRTKEIDVIIHRLLNEYNERQKTKLKEKRKKESSTIKGIYTEMLDNLDDDYHTRFQRDSWNQNTLNKTIVVARKVLKMMDAFGFDLEQTDMNDIKVKLEEKAFESKRSKKDIVLAAANIGDVLKRVDKILEVIYDYNQNIRRLYFDPETRRYKSKTESYKSIPQIVRRLMAEEILNSIDNGLAIGVAVMLLAGTRTAETAALLIGDINFVDRKFVTFEINKQLSNSGEINYKLKSPASHRIVIGSFLLYEIIERRIVYLKSKGYEDDAIKNLPLVSAADNPNVFCKTNNLSAYGKKLLEKCGLEEEHYRYMRTLSVQEKDLDDDGKPNRDIVNYTCRRDFASRCSNTCGLTPVEVDYLLGHENSDSVYVDFMNYDFQRIIARKLERSIILEEYSLNPASEPIIINYNEKELKEYEGFSCYRFVAPVEESVTCRIRIKAVSTEPAQKIYIKTFGTVNNCGLMKSGQLAVSENKNPQPPIVNDWNN